MPNSAAMPGSKVKVLKIKASLLSIAKECPSHVFGMVKPKDAENPKVAEKPPPSVAEKPPLSRKSELVLKLERAMVLEHAPKPKVAALKPKVPPKPKVAAQNAPATAPAKPKVAAQNAELPPKPVAKKPPPPRPSKSKVAALLFFINQKDADFRKLKRKLYKYLV